MSQGRKVRNPDNAYAGDCDVLALTVGQEIDLHSDTEASGVVCAHAELTMDGEAVRVALRYHDQYRFEDGRWRFAERDVKLLYAMRLAELPQHLADELRVRWPGTEPQPADVGPDA